MRRTLPLASGHDRAVAGAFWESDRGSRPRNGKPREPVGDLDTAATDCFVRGDDRAQPAARSI